MHMELTLSATSPFLEENIDGYESKMVLSDDSHNKQLNESDENLDEDFYETQQDECGENTPKVGMLFNSSEEVHEFYNLYAKRMGFGTSIKRSKSKDGQRKYFTLSCSKGGKTLSTAKNSFRGRPSIKTDCKARINATLQKDGRFALTLVCLNHNHAISPSKARFYRSNKRMDSHVKKRLELNDMAGIPLSKNFNSFVVEARGYENLSFGEKDCRNYIDKVRRLRLGVGDAEALCAYFHRMQKRNSNFYHSMDIDENFHIRNVFWADARSRAAYESFSDVVTFDSTYLTNKYDMPFAPFVGVNHHGQSILFGCGLISSEDIDTYTWLFETWLSCMSGRSPNAILTDQCKAIKGAIAKVFPNTHHRLCIWHIMKKIPEKLRGFAAYEAIKRALKNTVYNSLSVEEFEEGWRKMIEDYGLQDNEWLKSLYEDRNRWVPVFLNHAFWAGMSSTQRSESMNSFFDDYVNPKTSLKQFVEQYDNALLKKVEKEANADFHSFNSVLPLITSLYMEKQLRDVYTNDIFKMFQDEIKDLIYCSASFVNVDEQISKFSIKDISKPKDEDGKIREQVFYKVHFDADKLEVQCICCSFEFSGILCRHALYVLLNQNVIEIPSQYILSRWRKDIKRPHTFVRCSYNDDGVKDDMERYNKLYASFLETVELGSKSKDKCDLAMSKLEKLKVKLVQKDSPGGNKQQNPHYPISFLQNRIKKDGNIAYEDSEKSQLGYKVLSPIQVKRKGRPSSKRKESKVDKIVSNIKKKAAKRKSKMQNNQIDISTHKRRKVYQSSSNVDDQSNVSLIASSTPFINMNIVAQENRTSQLVHPFCQQAFDYHYGKGSSYLHLLQQCEKSVAKD